MEKLTIDQVIDHCDRKVKLYEERFGKENLEALDILSNNLAKEYYEHKYVKVWLEELKSFRECRVKRKDSIDRAKKRCEKCHTDRSHCTECREYPEYAGIPYRSLFTDHDTYCKYGYTDCIYDPGYIHHHYPDWYKELYGDKNPEDAAKKGCADCSDGDMYDDEDK